MDRKLFFKTLGLVGIGSCIYKNSSAKDIKPSNNNSLTVNKITKTINIYAGIEMEIDTGLKTPPLCVAFSTDDFMPLYLYPYGLQYSEKTDSYIYSLYSNETLVNIKMNILY